MGVANATGMSTMHAWLSVIAISAALANAEHCADLSEDRAAAWFACEPALHQWDPDRNQWSCSGRFGECIGYDTYSRLGAGDTSPTWARFRARFTACLKSHTKYCLGKKQLSEQDEMVAGAVAHKVAEASLLGDVQQDQTT